MRAPPGAASRRVSIVMPTFNRAALLRGAIEHCLAQTHAGVELIIVDDGSSDATPDLVRELADERVTYLRHEQNRGLPEALNTGFRRAAGAYLTWGSDDDRFAPTAIAELVGFLEDHPDVDFVYADYWLIDTGGEVIRRVRVDPPEKLAEWNCIGVCRLYRRAVAAAIGEYDPGARLAEDYDYWLRVARRFRMAALPRPLYYRREHANSLTGRFRFEALRAGERVRLAQGWTTPTAYRRALDVIDVREALAGGDRVAALRRALPAIVREPRHLGSRPFLSLLLEAVIGTRARQRVRAFTRRAIASARQPPLP